MTTYITPQFHTVTSVFLTCRRLRDKCLTAFAVAMGKEFGSGTTIKRGKVFDYLGMELDFESSPGIMIILMIKSLQKVIAEYPELIKKNHSLSGNEYPVHSQRRKG